MSDHQALDHMSKKYPNFWIKVTGRTFTTFVKMFLIMIIIFVYFLAIFFRKYFNPRKRDFSPDNNYPKKFFSYFDMRSGA